jgi:peroxiredoxin
MKRLGLLVVLLAIPALSQGGGLPQNKQRAYSSKLEPVKIQGQQQAPEFADISKWINSDPLTMQNLKGKVVAVHFLTYSCINCKHNYPWYKSVWAEFKDKDFAMIGIQTPEVDEEKNVPRAEKALKDAGLTFPIAIDNKTTMWRRYNNNTWPTVYLIDKQGIARWGWSGELGWKGATGGAQM